MNFLAHCYLSCASEDMLIGNIITDFTNKKEADMYKGGIKEGIELHRKIDTFTDKHDASLELRSLLRKRHGKYASVVVDLVWDYFLCQNWNRYSGTTLRAFADSIYPIILKNKEVLPSNLKKKINNMIKDDFLLAYENSSRMKKSLQWMDNRVKYPSNFIGAVNDVQENYDLIEKLFVGFFQDLINYVDTECNC